MENDSLLVRNIARKSFGKIPEIVSVPNLINLQKVSFENFLQLDVTPDKRKNLGLQSVFN